MSQLPFNVSSFYAPTRTDTPFTVRDLITHYHRIIIPSLHALKVNVPGYCRSLQVIHQTIRDLGLDKRIYPPLELEALYLFKDRLYVRDKPGVLGIDDTLHRMSLPTLLVKTEPQVTFETRVADAMTILEAMASFKTFHLAPGQRGSHLRGSRRGRACDVPAADLVIAVRFASPQGTSF
jgi:hypothetical protein